MIRIDPRNREVIFPVINGQELNSEPEQKPGRSIINFFDWSEEHARTYPVPFERIERLVKPIRETNNRQLYREKWWLYCENRPGLRIALSTLKSCFIAAATTKYLNFSVAQTNVAFTKALWVFTTDRWDLYAVVQSTIHEVWARKYSGALKQDLSYSPSDCFETFPLPEGLWQTANPVLAAIGERYHEHRRALMHQLWLGLTSIYNLFHSRDLTPAMVAKVSKTPEGEAKAGYQGILDLRRLHRELDEAIRDSYGWFGLDLGHNFVEMETLPENDRIRFTMSPSARKEVLRRLLALNQSYSTTQAVRESTKKKRGKKSSQSDDKQYPIF